MNEIKVEDKKINIAILFLVNSSFILIYLTQQKIGVDI